ncbi:MAG: hypothetical protein RBS37_00435 [Bacteroidales bacterium]|jgi:hypothetical protein|nr:hypothetical protein [Bacteroidales bacterium]
MGDRKHESGIGQSLLSRRKHSDRDIIVFGFFLVLSFIFWYLNGLSKEIENHLKYPVRYINPPREMVLVGNMPSRLEMLLSGPGYSLLKLRLSGSRAPVVIDMSRLDYRPVPGSAPDDYYVLTSDLADNFHRQMRADFLILDIDPDTLKFVFDRLGSKKVPVVADIEVVTDKEFFVKDRVLTNPDSVTITGPLPVIDTVRFVSTRNRRFTGINRPFTSNIQLAGSRDYTMSEKRVSVTVDVEQYTEARIDLRVRLINQPDSLDLKLFPDEVDVRLQVAVSDYNGVFESNMQAVIDLAEINIEGLEKLPVTIINVPPFVRALMYSPQELDYLIETRQR